MSTDLSAETHLNLNGIPVRDTFAEAFPMTGTRLIITAYSADWARQAAHEFCGNATSVIACDVETALERELSADETPDGRPGVSLLAFAFDKKGLESAVTNRVGQCILTCPTTACFNGLPTDDKEKKINIGGQIRFFGDGYQSSKKLGSQRFWRIPVMDGEFLCEEKFGTIKGVGGGNLLIAGDTTEHALQAAEASATAMREIPDIILPFPGGIVRSGSKVGSKYKTLKASTNHEYCPSLQGQVDLNIPSGTQAVYEIVIDGLSEQSVADAMKVGLHAAAACEGILLITAGNYGGKLGKFHFHLKDLL
ncbi:MAG: formylmethanofuran--tetrahydromethanopterin N-formyltransferase [Planctomycetaceae bacterium]|jgi:formylmethanofuran--tetrahydromethanopterin N-formyltransferase|nr:formylmethanofuran--tetrahydromethanopterin N-formyltransferase [Planctomycetaceae bacterium]